MKYTYQGKPLIAEVDIYHDAIPYLAGISMHDFFMDKVACARAWREGTAYLKDYFGDMLPMRRPSPAPLSYGHMICLGAPVNIPKEGEPNVSHFADSIDEAIDIMKANKDTQFEKNEFFQYYLEVWDYLKSQFPDENIPFGGFGAQGPLTSAVLLRGQDFLMDLYDEPEKCKEFLTLLTDSIIAYQKLLRRINGKPEVQESGGIADDFSSLVPPAMWYDFVLPFLNREYEALSYGTKRSLHLENLTPKHLPLLTHLKLTHFQPSVSDMLTLDSMKQNLNPDIPFDWLLYAYHVTNMNEAEIQAWVDNTIAAGCRYLRTQFGTYACQIGKLDRIKMFLHAFDKYAQ